MHIPLAHESQQLLRMTLCVANIVSGGPNEASLCVVGVQTGHTLLTLPVWWSEVVGVAGDM